MEPQTATIEAMKEVTGPVVATTLVLLAVFAPTAVMPGITGQMYAQFSVTICIAVLISSINALTLSPALCASLLKPPKHHDTGFHGAFNRVFNRLTGRILAHDITLPAADAAIQIILGDALPLNVKSFGFVQIGQCLAY